MLEKLKSEMELWANADSVTPVIPAIHYVAITAQPEPGAGSTYRLRMPASQLDRAVKLAEQINGIVFLDIQIGHSTVENEVNSLLEYLKLPNVHLGLDPEYSMRNGGVPCERIGTMDAADINKAADILERLVREYNLPPKSSSCTGLQKKWSRMQKIKPRPEVQVIVNMDGFGAPAKKKDSYKIAVVNEPVQFAGFKLFYKQDIRGQARQTLMTPAEVLALYPKPIYIQYQ